MTTHETNPYRLRFGTAAQIFPVIHVLNVEQTLRNIEIAQTADVAGVFLIDMRGMPGLLVKCYLAARRAAPDLWIGLNYLEPTKNLIFQAAIEYALPERPLKGLQVNLAGLWTDDKGDSGSSKVGLSDIRRLVCPEMIHFGGVAFKGQPQPNNLYDDTFLSRRTINVVTTSGPGTGQEADIRKIELMHKALQGHPFAIASGISAGNIRDYLGLVDAFLVATSITDPLERIIPDKLAALMEASRS